jgi:DNA polymerase III subunit alpha
MALFRPATMNTGATRAFIARKHNEAGLPLRHELIMAVTKDTQGIMLYQEQVIDLLRGLGMDADNLTAFLKAVKASNKDIGSAGDVIESYHQWITAACERVGMTDADQSYLHDAIAGFAEYGFNRAHATVYGITAYRAAYLAARHPVQFHTALLGVASGGEAKKENRYIRATKRRGIRVLAPDINISGATYTIDEQRDAVRKGLQSVDGVGYISASKLESLQPFEGLDDLVERSATAAVSGHKEYDGTPESLTGILGKLRDSGCLANLTNLRRIHESM